MGFGFLVVIFLGGKITRLIIAILLLPVPRVLLFFLWDDDANTDTADVVVTAVAITGIVTFESWTLDMLRDVEEIVPWGSECPGHFIHTPSRPLAKTLFGFGKIQYQTKWMTLVFYDDSRLASRWRCAFWRVQKSLLARVYSDFWRWER